MPELIVERMIILRALKVGLVAMSLMLWSNAVALAQQNPAGLVLPDTARITNMMEIPAPNQVHLGGLCSEIMETWGGWRLCEVRWFFPPMKVITPISAEFIGCASLRPLPLACI
ncbi:MAG: hypothetical protein M1330_02015 [Armatimonadetes bacterium]|nr:hypothetical protein [Armatimonadota bacterium]